MLTGLPIIAFLGVLLLILCSFKKTILHREGKLYLIRWTFIKTKWFTLKVHKVYMSDPAIMHDHPWNYISLILKGGYWEEARDEFDIPYKMYYKPGSILFRKGDKPHRLILPSNAKSSLSLILTTKKYRIWGFSKSPHHWMSHKEMNY